jgi:hypothetical protein
MTKPAKLKVGDAVIHPKFGPGRILNQWGVITDIDERGKILQVNCGDVFDVRFEDNVRPINACRLQLLHPVKKSPKSQNLSV